MQTETNTTRVAVISIIVENPERVSDINDILHTAAPHIIGRMGIPTVMNNLSIIEQLKTTQTATREQLIFLLKNITGAEREELRQAAQQTAQAVFGNKIYIRGLVEISSICKRDCRYCGLRRSNPNAVRYRLAPEQILSCCEKGYALGFRTFVLQGGEDGFFSDEVVCGVVREIKRRYPDCAVTLSLGERGDESFRRLYAAGADRYLLRHETADLAHYAKLHPDSMSGAERQRQLFVLKQTGFQTGAGFMVGSPYQTAENLADDLLFLKKLQPLFAGQLGADAHPAGGYPAHASAYSLACHHGARHDSSAGQGAGNFARRKRRHAQSVALGAPQGLRDI